MSEKTEKPTPYFLQKAREKGQASKSNELTTCLTLLVMLGMIAGLWTKQSDQIKALIRHLLSLATHCQFSLDNISRLQQFIINKLILLWLPFAMAGTLAVVIGTLAQTGLIWSGTPLVPDLKRLNLHQGFKRIFSVKIFFEMAKNILKLTAAFSMLFFVLRHQLPHVLQLTLTPLSQHPSLIINFLLKIIFQLLIVLTIMSCIDTFYTRWSFTKAHRMSKQDIKEEYRQREGDPKIKSRIRQLQYQLRQKTASLNQVKSADIVITNPTHLAIALKYEQGLMPAPKVVCKAQGEMVAQVKEIARKRNIPIIENKLFARALYQSVELNQWISSDLFPVAASIFRELYKQRNEV